MVHFFNEHTGISQSHNSYICLLTVPFKWKCTSSENHTLCIVTSSDSAHAISPSLCSLSWAVSSYITVILWGYSWNSLHKISCTNHLDILNPATAFCKSQNYLHSLLNCKPSYVYHLLHTGRKPRANHLALATPDAYAT